MNSLVTTAKVSHFNDRTIRLIPTAFHKPPVLEQLAPSFGARGLLENLEGVTSGRQVAQQTGVPGISAAALATGYGYTFINAAFAYTRPGGNRFNPGDWGAWYSALEAKTALKEVSFHLTRALTAAGGEYDNTTYYAELFATFDAEFTDLRDIDPRPGCLSEDTDVAYPEGQKIGAGLRRAGGNGIIYPSIRDPGGTCLVAFWPGLVQNFQRGQQWKLEWAGEPEPTVVAVASS